MFSIRFISENDKQFWFSLDKHLSESEFALKVRDRRGYIICDGGKPIGIMRYNLFWDNTPFLTLIYIEEACQGKGFGGQAMLHWEYEMYRLGYRMLMTSTQTDEQAQHFYRKLGYVDKGCLILDNTPFEQPQEIILIKVLDKAYQITEEKLDHVGKEDFIMVKELAMSLKLDAVGLFVSDMDKMVAFYRDTLGMQTDWDGKAPNVELYSGGYHLTLYRRDDFEKDISRKFSYHQGINGAMELGYEVKDYAAVDREYERIIKSGGTAIMPPTTIECWGERTCIVADPDGNLVEIRSLTKE
jgi:catechol 2,3-dioxygenase-like lactoylglutathione lyase family enzyme/GNAT superfamily N-acetyltransferase